MSSSSFLLASFSLSQLLEWWRKLDGRHREMVVGLGAVAVMALFLVGLLITLARETRRHHHHHHHHSHDDTDTPESTAQSGDDSTGHKRRKWRRRRRPHRPRNPTLAETGGLPPLRSQPPPESRP